MRSCNPAPPRLAKQKLNLTPEHSTLLCIQTTSFCKTSIFIIPNGREQNKAIGKQPSFEPWRLSWAQLCSAVLNLKFISLLEDCFVFFVVFLVLFCFVWIFSETVMKKHHHTNTKSQNQTRKRLHHVFV